MPGAAEDAADHFGSVRGFIFDQADGAGDGAGIAAQDALGQRDRRGVRHDVSSWRAMTSRWISLVPSPMVSSFTSRKYFSAG